MEGGGGDGSMDSGRVGGGLGEPATLTSYAGAIVWMINNVYQELRESALVALGKLEPATHRGHSRRLVRFWAILCAGEVRLARTGGDHPTRQCRGRGRARARRRMF